MTLNSSYAHLGAIKLPVWQGRQRYMHTFNPQSPVMAEGYEDYLATVTALCLAAEDLTNHPIHEVHMTVDEKIVQPGMSQRRDGAHVDGCFMPVLQVWGHPEPKPFWAHYCNNLPIPRMSIIVAHQRTRVHRLRRELRGRASIRWRPGTHPRPAWPWLAAAGEPRLPPVAGLRP